ncbi:MAG: PKD domain-containing protein [Cyclobacteriaceae bacterium]
MNIISDKVIKLFVLMAAMVYLTGCGDDDVTEVPEPPVASFSLAVDTENTLMVSFTNSSLDGQSYSWDFGDNAGTSTEENPTYTYSASGTYTITLTVTNDDGTDQATDEVTVSGFGPNLVANGDMSTDESWSELAIWSAEDNAVDHRITDGVFRFQNGEDESGGRYQWSNYAVFQEITLEAGATYQFSADVSSTSGTNATWFEVYLVKDAPIDESNIGGDATQVAIKSFGDGENCTADAFNGGFLEVAANCSAVNSFDKLIDSNGNFTVQEADLSANGTIFLVFKAGSGFAPEGETAGFNDGIDLDNVSIKKVL